MTNRWWNNGNNQNLLFFGSSVAADGDCSHEIKIHLLLWRKAMTNLDNILKSRDITLLTKVCIVKAMVFPVVVYGCKSWLYRKLSTKKLTLLNCGVGDDSRESLGQKGDQAVSPKGNQYWIFIGRTHAEAETPILWSPDAKNWLTGEDSDACKDWRQKKGTTEDEMVGWHHQINGPEFRHGWGVEGQGILESCSHGFTKSWTRLSNWNELKIIFCFFITSVQMFIATFLYSFYLFTSILS